MSWFLTFNRYFSDQVNEFKKTTQSFLVHFPFGLHQIWVSFVSSIIVVPPNLLIDILFRKSRNKPNKVHPLTCSGKNNSGFFACFKLHTWSSKGSSSKSTDVSKVNLHLDSSSPSADNKSLCYHGDEHRWSIATWNSSFNSSEFKRPMTDATFCDDSSLRSNKVSSRLCGRAHKIQGCWY